MNFLSFQVDLDKNLMKTNSLAAKKNRSKYATNQFFLVP